MNELSTVLMPVLANEDPTSINYMIAQYIMENTASLASASTADLARACNVSKASISRFCKHVGLEDFVTLRYLIRHYEPMKKVVFEDSLEHYFVSVKHSVETLETCVQQDTLDELTIDLYRFKKVTVMGTPQTFGAVIAFQNELSTLGKIVGVQGHISKQIQCLKQSTSADLVIIFSDNNEIFKQMIHRYNGNNRQNIPKIYLITTDKKEHYNFIYKTIHLGSDNRYTTMILMNIFANLVVINYKKGLKYSKYFASTETEKNCHPVMVMHR